MARWISADPFGFDDGHEPIIRNRDSKHVIRMVMLNFTRQCVGEIGFVAAIAIFAGCSKSANYDAITVQGELQPGGEAFVTGRDILIECQRAYGNLALYTGTIQVTGVAGYDGLQRPVQPRCFQVKFQSPGQLQFKGENSNGSPLVISVDEHTATVQRKGKTEILAAEEALYASSGVTLYGSLFLPGSLLNVSWKNEASMFPKDMSYLSAWGTKAELNGTRKLGGLTCHRIICERETGTWTIYVDTDSMLLRRVDYEVTAAQMKELEKYGEGGGASGAVTSMSRSQVYGIDEVKWKSDSKMEVDAN